MAHLLVMAVMTKKRSTDFKNIAIIYIKKKHAEFILKILVKKKAKK